MTSSRRTLSSTRKNSAGHAESGAAARISSQIASMRGVSRRVTARLLTSIAGPWSHIPVQDVVSMLTRPSSEVLPRSTQSAPHMCSRSSMLPSIRSVMLSLNSTRYRPRGCV